MLAACCVLLSALACAAAQGRRDVQGVQSDTAFSPVRWSFFHRLTVTTGFDDKKKREPLRARIMSPQLGFSVRSDA